MFEVSVIKYSRILGPGLYRTYASVGRPDLGSRHVACDGLIVNTRFSWIKLIFSVLYVYIFFLQQVVLPIRSKNV